jgi:mannosidase alpha-like ER degradation enhancer 2
MRMLTNLQEAAKRAVKEIYEMRLAEGLVGSHIDVMEKKWSKEGLGKFTGIGSGVDSFYEYLLKSYLLFGDKESLDMFEQFYSAIKANLKQGPWYVSVNVDNFKVIMATECKF